MELLDDHMAFFILIRIISDRFFFLLLVGFSFYCWLSVCVWLLESLGKIMTIIVRHFPFYSKPGALVSMYTVEVRI